MSSQQILVYFFVAYKFLCVFFPLYNSKDSCKYSPVPESSSKFRKPSSGEPEKKVEKNRLSAAITIVVILPMLEEKEGCYCRPFFPLPRLFLSTFSFPSRLYTFYSRTLFDAFLLTWSINEESFAGKKGICVPSTSVTVSLIICSLVKLIELFVKWLLLYGVWWRGKGAG